MKLVHQFREASPDVAIRTTFIVGFPGETETHLANLERFLEQAEFDRVGVFEYSVEEGTPSAGLPDRVPARVKRARKDRLMRLQQPISLARNQRWLGREMEVLIESSVLSANNQSRTENRKPKMAIGRSFRDGPEVDGQVFVSDSDAHPGDFITARITAAQEYDLIARRVDQAA